MAFLLESYAVDSKLNIQHSNSASAFPSHLLSSRCFNAPTEECLSNRSAADGEG
jgi:hypothetical protein